MQRNWIGRSEGAHVDFAVEGHEPVTVFTTRPDTLFGATFMVVAADATLADELVADEQRQAFEDYLDEVRKESDIERLSTERPKTGRRPGRHRDNPVNGERIPVWAADYVLADYGTGAIMAVPGQDQRDWEFAKKFDLPIVRTVAAARRLRGRGVHRRRAGDQLAPTTRSRWTAWRSTRRRPRSSPGWRAKGRARAPSTSGCATGCCRRQRFWGAPIPIIHCEKCGEVAVPYDQLPVRAARRCAAPT